MNVQVHETYIDKVRGIHCGESDWHDPPHNNRRGLFRFYQCKHGRCVSKIYRDRLQVNGSMAAVEVGWVFERRTQYSDSKKSFVLEVWVEIREEDDRP